MLRTILIACKNYWMPQLLSPQTGRYWCIFITILIVINYPAVSRVTFTTLQTSSRCRFTFHASLSQVGLGYTLRQDIRNEYQVVSVDELPWYTSAKLALKARPAPGWTGVGYGKSPDNTHSHTKLPIVLTTVPQTTPGIGAHHALNDTQNAFPHRGFPTATTGPL